MSHFSLKFNIYHGFDELERLGEVTCKLGDIACVVLDPFFSGGPLQDRLSSILKKSGISFIFFSDFKSDPDCSDVDRCVALSRERGCNVIIAVGGGSSIDAAKATALTMGNGGFCWDWCVQRLPSGRYGYANIAEKPALPIVAIPTTSGTGSEANGGAVISNKALFYKSGFRYPSTFPSASIVDPKLVVGLPPNQTALTGFDAFSHAFESYMLIGLSTYYSEMIALESIRLFGAAFHDSVMDGTNLEARSLMAQASTLAGMNIALTDTCVGHILGQPLSALFHLTHGATLSVLFEALIEWLEPAAPERLARITEILDPSLFGRSCEENAMSLKSIIHDLRHACGIDQTLRDYGITEKDISTILSYVENKIGFDNSVFRSYARVADREDLAWILKRSL